MKSETFKLLLLIATKLVFTANFLLSIFAQKFNLKCLLNMIADKSDKNEY